MYRITIIICVFISSCFYAQQNKDFESVKKYYDYQRYMITKDLKAKFENESNLIKKSQIENAFFDIMKKVDSVENKAYIQALITTKNKEDLRLLFPVNSVIKYSKNLGPPPPALPIKKDTDKKYAPVEKEAQYPGGIDELRKEVAQYFYLGALNNDLKKASTVISFIVEKDGSIAYAKAEGEDAGFNTQAEIAVYRLEHKFIPAYIDGKPARYKYRIPINMNFE